MLKRTMSIPVVSGRRMLRPREIVSELDKYIVGQDEAKRAVAIALRNRWRRQRLSAELRDEVAPKNIIMIGPTGVGKTEIARRLARLAQAPFLKVEASRYTEVGYVGRDVESMVRDLTDLAVGMVRSEQSTRVKEKAAKLAEERLLELLLPSPSRPVPMVETVEAEAALGGEVALGGAGPGSEQATGPQATREKLRRELVAGKLDKRLVEIEVKDRYGPMVEILSTTGAGVEELDISIGEMMGKMFPARTKRRKVSVGEAKRILEQEEADKLIDMEQVVRDAIERVENSGIIFLDELDKIAGRESGMGPDVSREGVQRDILPIVEGTTVATKYGMVRTDHILFIAAGAFHVSKPSDLIPELQGRFPIRVELRSLNREDFRRILTEPRNSLIRQYTALLKTEGIDILFTEDAVEEIAAVAETVNEQTEAIGARRLYTIMEKLLEDISFNAPEVAKEITIDRAAVQGKLSGIMANRDLSRYIL